MEMVKYCEIHSCRREYLLNYFGEEMRTDCKACDRCSGLEELVVNKGNDDLFERLRKLRKQLADKNKVPPYVIFSDATLRGMVDLLPRNEVEFLQVNGVGQEKLKRYGYEFLTAINNRNNNLAQTYWETKKLIDLGESIEMVAKTRGFKPGTIVCHLEKLKLAGEKMDLDRFRPDRERFENIKQAFEKTKGWKLSPVKEILGDNYSYDEIRIAKLFL